MLLFSAPEPKAQVHYCDHGLSVVNFSHFSTSLKPLNRIQGNLTVSKISTSFTKFVFFEQIGKTRWLPCPLIGWHIFDFFSETAERNSTKLDRKQDLNVLYQVCIFRADQKNKMAALASDWLHIFDFFSVTAERNSTKLDRKQDLNVLYQVCVFRVDRKKKGPPGLWLAESFSTSSLKLLNGIQRNLTGSKISTSSTKFVFFRQIVKTNGRYGLWLAESFCWLLLWNRWMECKETWQEARSQRPLPSLCFQADE